MNLKYDEQKRTDHRSIDTSRPQKLQQELTLVMIVIMEMHQKQQVNYKLQ